MFLPIGCKIVHLARGLAQLLRRIIQLLILMCDALMCSYLEAVSKVITAVWIETDVLIIIFFSVYFIRILGFVLLVCTFAIVTS